MLSEKIKKYRLDNNLTQLDLANKLFVSRNAVSKWERDEGYPNIDTLKDLAKLMNVSIDELLGQDDVKTIVVNNNEILNKYKSYLCNLFVFISYCLVAILIPHLILAYDPTAIMAYCLIIAPVSFIILGVITPLYNKHMLNTFIAGALSITPILIYFEVYTNTIIYYYEIIYYIIFIVSYCLMLKVLKINLKNNIKKIIKWISLGLLVFLITTYIVLCIISFIRYNDSYSAPIYTQSLVYTFIFIVPIIVCSIIYCSFKKRI